MSGFGNALTWQSATVAGMLTVHSMPDYGELPKAAAVIPRFAATAN
jgi:hypothetical protein